MKRSIFVLFLVSGCAATFVKHESDQPDIYTVGRETGTVAEDGLYKVSFEKAAEEKCPQGYTVLERTRNPSTLAKVGIEPANDRFYWVIKCTGKSAT